MINHRFPYGFIVGVSRAGTTWVSNALNRHSLVCVFGETGFWGRNYVSPSKGYYTDAELSRVIRGVALSNLSSTRIGPGGDGARAIAISSVRKLVETNKSLTPAEIFTHICESIGTFVDKEYVIEKTPHHINWVDRISKAYPRAYFVAMTREPYGFMRSYKHQGDRKSAAIRRRFHGKYHPISCAIVYKSYLREINKLRNRSSSKCLVIEFDRLRDCPDLVLREIQVFLDLPVEEGLAGPRVNSSFGSAPIVALKPVDMFWMNLIVGSTFQAAGYELRPSGVKPFSVLMSILQLPRWAWSVASDWNRKSSGNIIKYVIKWFK